jgi:excisionase family DNA binding protein
MSDTANRLLLNLKEAAQLLGITERQLYGLTRARSRLRQRVQIPTVRLGKKLMFRRESLETWVRQLEDQRVTASA